MKTPLLARYRAFSLTLSLVPAFFVLEHVGSEGFPEAQGCSGGPNTGAGVAPPQTATIRRQPGSANVEVATDAFFLIDSYSFAPPDPSNIDVAVTTLEGVVVAGTVKVLQPSNGQPFYSWSASEPLAVGTQLEATVAPTFSGFGAPDQAVLEVVGAPSELAVGILNADKWLDYGHGVGPTVTCKGLEAPCASPRELSLPGAEQMLHAASYSWSPAAAIRAFVAWEITLERAGATAADTGLTAPSASVFFGDRDERLQLGTLPYPLGTSKYCAKYTVRDLRTDSSESGELCSPVGTSSETLRDYPLAECSHPPSAELTEAWCKLHPGSTFAECVPFDPTAKPIENDPMPQDPPNEPDPQAEPSDDAMAASSGTSSGCQLSASASRPSGLALLLAATALSAALRRRRAAR